MNDFQTKIIATSKSNEARMKAGDIILSSANTWASRGIRLATISRYSHAAIAISECELLEATSNGISIIQLDSFIESNTTVLLLKRNHELTSNQQSKLIQAAQNKNGLHYNTYRTLNSGFSKLGFYIVLFSILFIFLFAIINNQFNSPFFISLILISILAVVLYYFADPVKSNKILKLLGVQKKYLTDLNGHFCSQLVLEICEYIGGGPYDTRKWPNEPRPKDIKILALNFGFTPEKIKPNKALQRTSA